MGREPNLELQIADDAGATGQGLRMPMVRVSGREVAAAGGVTRAGEVS